VRADVSKVGVESLDPRRPPTDTGREIGRVRRTQGDRELVPSIQSRTHLSLLRRQCHRDLRPGNVPAMRELLRDGAPQCHGALLPAPRLRLLHVLARALDQYVADHIFTEYAYFSWSSDSWVQHARRYTGEMTRRFGPGPMYSRAIEPAPRADTQRRFTGGSSSSTESALGPLHFGLTVGLNGIAPFWARFGMYQTRNSVVSMSQPVLSQ
jgi:hypothetical protein